MFQVNFIIFSLIFLFFLDENKEKEIYFEYIAKNFVRKINKFYYKNTEENNMKFIIDNYGNGNKIQSNVRINLEDRIDVGNMYTYPQRKKVRKFIKFFSIG